MSVSARRMKRTSITKKAPGRVASFRIAAGQATTVVGAGGIDWVAETNYVSGGTAATTTHIVSMNGVANPAPLSVYQNERWGVFTYTVHGLAAGEQYAVRLHFAEVYYTAVGQRIMNVTANGNAVVSNFDIFAAAGGQDKAIVRDFFASADTDGTLVLAFSASTSGQDAKVCGIELSGNIPLSDVPTGLNATLGSKYVALRWSAPVFPSGAVQGYNIYQDGIKINTSLVTDLAYNPGKSSAALAPSTQYTFTVKTVVNGVESGGVSKTIATLAAGASTVYPANVLWLSGSSNEAPQFDNAMQFANWRGQASRYCTTWVEPYDNGYGGGGAKMYLDGGYTEVLNVSKHGTDDFTWQKAADGSLDGYFNGFADGLVQLANASNMREIHANFGFELNGDWMRHSIIRGSRTGWASVLPYVGAGWRRYANIMRSKASGSKIPIKICLNFTHQNAGDQSIQQIVNAIGTDYFDFLGLDHYDAWQPTPSKYLLNQSEWDIAVNHYMGDGSPDGYGSWFDYARSIGKAVTLPEWGLCDIRSEVTDNPFYIQKVNEFFRTRLPVNPGVPEAGKLYGESYFNLESICRLSYSTSVSNSAAAYNNAVWGEM